MALNSKRLGLLSLVVLTVSATFALAGDEKNVEINGFLLGNSSGRTTGLRPEDSAGGDFLLAEERVRLDIYVWSDYIEASARIKGDFFHDAVSGEFDVDLREAYIDYTTSDFDFRLGRQIVTWGVGDLLFINDVFPKDWVSFFSGRPLEYLKIGVDGFRARLSSNAVNTELLIIPFFQPDNLPTSDRFFYFDPFAAVPLRQEVRPKTTYGNTELALRFYRQIRNFDISAYAYRGFWRSASARPDNFAAPTRATTFYPDLSVYGFSAQGNAMAGILSLEMGYYHSGDDKKGDDPIIPNHQMRFLVGYQRQLWEDFTFGLQYYGEIMDDYSAYKKSLPAGFPAQKEYRDVVTLRLEQLLKYQTWKLSLFTFYSPADNDYLIQPQASHKFSDKFSATMGANVFGGEKGTTFLGQFDKNDNIYISVRFDF
ncbi:MAG: hypothetical protein ACE5JC_00185 [Candidatus Zixiibacteriota bacterium]